MKLNIQSVEIARGRKMFTKKELAREAGLPPTTLYSMYQNKSGRVENIGKIARALGVDILEILEQ